MENLNIANPYMFWSNVKNVLLLYPSPNNNLYIEFPGMGETVLINIYDAAGKFVQTRTLQNQNVLTLPVSKLARGKYVIEVSDGIIKLSKSFIKE